MKACVVVAEDNLKKAISIVEKFDLAEIRLDLCQFNTQQIKQLFSKKKGLIATYRTKKAEDTLYKMDLLKSALEAGASFIDLEHDFDSKLTYEMILYAKNYGAKVIISYHDYEKTLSIEQLEEFIDIAKKRGADIIKIATKCNSKEDCIRLMDLYKHEKNLVAFGLGENAKYTRVMSLFLGAPYAYVSFGNRNKITEGQIGHKEFESILEGFRVA